jgi:phosphopantothenoylcysteine decarboxylase/phosphopantothenate--cysteine ligase
LVAGNTADLATPAGVDLVRVGSAVELRDVMHKVSADADVVVMAAAVADFRPSSLTGHKIKKTDGDPDPITLTKNPDILVELVSARRTGQLIVGFAAETGDETTSVLDYGRAKLRRKGCDLLVLNAVGDGKAFEQDDNAGWLLSPDGAETPIPHGPKTQVASEVWDAVSARLTTSQ